MTVLPEALSRFLSSYLAVEKDRGAAIRTFASNEGAEDLRDLLLSIRNVFQADPPESELRDGVEKAANLKLRPGMTAQRFLLDLFSSVAREGGFSGDVKAYDAFISYSSQDRQLAARLAADLRRNGYALWLDSDEVLVGHNILDEVYRGILQSEFLIVLLTNHSINSRWVREELSAARVEEIERARVTVLPVKCEEQVQIPFPLITKRFANLAASYDEGVQEIMRAIDLHRGGLSGSVVASVQRPAAHEQLTAWSQQVVQEPLQFGFDPNRGGFKDFIIGTADGEPIRLEKRRLMPLLESTRVRIQGWGGAPFPYEALKAKLENVPEGVRLLDNRNWLASEWNFYYWKFTESARFFERAALLEDGAIDASGEVVLRGCLNVVWVIKDVCMALLFCGNLLQQIPQMKRAVLIQRFSGMRDRKLIIRGFARAPLLGEYVSGLDDIEQVSTIGRGDDLESEALRVLGEIFWVFNWNTYDSESFKPDVRSFLAGRFPQGWS